MHPINSRTQRKPHAIMWMVDKDLKLKNHVSHTKKSNITEYTNQQFCKTWNSSSHFQPSTKKREAG